MWPVAYSDLLAIAAVLALLSYILIDELLLRAAIGSSTEIVAFFGIITHIGKAEWVLIPSGIVCLVLVFFNWQALPPRRQIWLSNALFDAWFLFLATAGSGILVSALKFIVGRARPKLLDSVGFGYFDPFRFEATFASLPSGHSTTIAAVAVVLSLRFPRITPFFVWMALMIGASRVYVGAHYPSDVLMGLTSGTLFALFLARSFAVRKTGFRFVENGPMVNAIPTRHIVRGLRQR